MTLGHVSAAAKVARPNGMPGFFRTLHIVFSISILTLYGYSRHLLHHSDPNRVPTLFQELKWPNGIAILRLRALCHHFQRIEGC